MTTDDVTILTTSPTMYKDFQISYGYGLVSALMVYAVHVLDCGHFF
jgi:hypothetical protein